MSGRHKWSELKSRMTPECRERMAAKTASLRSMSPPTTYAQIHWAAETYRARTDCKKYVRAYAKVSDCEFRYAALNGCDDETAERLRKFLADFECRTDDYEKRYIQGVLRRESSRLKSLVEVDLEAINVDDSAFDAIELTFNRLVHIKGVSGTTASKILAVVLPNFCVMWDNNIHEEYFPDFQPRDDSSAYRYRCYLSVMRDAALSIAADHSELKSNGSPLLIAKSIDEYNFLTITKDEIYPAFVSH